MLNFKQWDVKRLWSDTNIHSYTSYIKLWGIWNCNVFLKVQLPVSDSRRMEQNWNLLDALIKAFDTI